jgi:hypothetical protein
MIDQGSGELNDVLAEGHGHARLKLCLRNERELPRLMRVDGVKLLTFQTPEYLNCAGLHS